MRGRNVVILALGNEIVSGGWRSYGEMNVFFESLMTMITQSGSAVVVRIIPSTFCAGSMHEQVRDIFRIVESPTPPGGCYATILGRSC